MARGTVKHMMLTTVRGQFSDFESTVELDRKDPSPSSVSVAIRTASGDIKVSDRVGDLISGA